METNEKIFKTLKNSGIPMKTCEIAGETGIDKKEVDKAIKKLEEDDKVYCPKNSYYIAK